MEMVIRIPFIEFTLCDSTANSEVLVANEKKQEYSTNILFLQDVTFPVFDKGYPRKYWFEENKNKFGERSGRLARAVPENDLQPGLLNVFRAVFSKKYLQTISNYVFQSTLRKVSSNMRVVFKQCAQTT